MRQRLLSESGLIKVFEGLFVYRESSCPFMRQIALSALGLVYVVAEVGVRKIEESE